MVIIDNGYGVVTVKETTTGTTTDAYVAVQETDVAAFRTTIHYVKNTGGANGLKYKIEGTIDGSNYEELKTETTLASGVDYFETDTDAWDSIKISVKAAVGASQTTYSVTVKGITGPTG
tara:strand:- start:466 stop:822 length:357 start_codon:yes stop_codon:yes gene_type:complete